MRFLVDAQLPPALARWLAERGHIAEHVFDLGQTTADGRKIWEYEAAAGASIATNYYALPHSQCLPHRIVFVGRTVANAGIKVPLPTRLLATSARPGLEYASVREVGGSPCRTAKGC